MSNAQALRELARDQADVVKERVELAEARMDAAHASTIAASSPSLTEKREGQLETAENRVDIRRTLRASVPPPTRFRHWRTERQEMAHARYDGAMARWLILIALVLGLTAMLFVSSRSGAPDGSVMTVSAGSVDLVDEPQLDDVLLGAGAESPGGSIRFRDTRTGNWILRRVPPGELIPFDVRQEVAAGMHRLIIRIGKRCGVAVAQVTAGEICDVEIELDRFFVGLGVTKGLARPGSLLTLQLRTKEGEEIWRETSREAPNDLNTLWVSVPKVTGAQLHATWDADVPGLPILEVSESAKMRYFAPQQWGQGRTHSTKLEMPTIWRE